MVNSQNLRYTLSLDDRFTNRMNSAISRTNKLDSTFDKLGSRIASIGIGAAIVSFGSSVIDSLKNYEYFSASLRTLMHGDKEAANLLQGQLVSLAKTSPFSLVDVQDSSKKLLAYGFAAGEVTDQLKMLGDISSATGNGIGDVAYLYGTLKTQGKAMTKDLYQFTNRGINLIPHLAKQFGIAQSQVYDFAQQGKISFKEVETAFKSMTSEGGDFFGMMEAQSKTVGGKLSNLGDAWEQLKVTIGNSQTSIIGMTTEWLTKMTNAYTTALKTGESMLKSFRKHGGIGYSAMDYMTMVPGMGGAMANDEALQKGLDSKYVEKSTQSIAEATKSKLAIAKMMLALVQDKNKTKDIAAYTRKMAILKGAMEQVDSNIKALNSDTWNKGTVSDLGEETDAKKQIKEKTTEISGSKPQNFTINITKLIETQNVTAQSIAESLPKIKEMVSKVLLEAVNDVNYIVR